MSDALRIDNNHFTYSDYRDWELAPGERYELFEGEPVAMAAPTAYHQAILTALTAKVYNFFENKPCRSFVAPYDVRLFYREDDSDDTVVQPDLSVVCDERKRGAEGCRGAPDLVVEILSPSNNAFEMSRKYNLYLRAGVREYWLIDPEAKAMQTFHLENTKAEPRFYGEKETAESFIFDNLRINLEAVFAE